MGKIIETKINDFSGGISDDPREIALNKFRIAKHFDISNPKKLVPYRSLEDESPAAGNSIANFLYSSRSELLGLGKVLGQTYPAIWYKQGTDLVTDAWAVDRTNWVGTQYTVLFPLFIEFNLCIYFATQTGTTIYLAFAYTNHTSGALDDNWQTLSGTPTANGLVHSKMNKLFIPCKNATTGINYIASVDSASNFDADCAPSISTNYQIEGLAEWGSYVAIACRDTTGGNSKVIIWDGVSTTTFIDVVDFGKDALYVLNNLEGYLIGISQTPTGIFSGDTAKLTVQMYDGGKPALIKEIGCEKLGTSAPSISIYGASTYPKVNLVQDNKLYFAAKIDGGSSPSPSHIGLFSIGRKNSSFPMAINYEQFATTDNSETAIMAAIKIGSITWFVHTAAGTITRTNDQQVYLSTSIYESQIFNGELHGLDSSYTKKLLGVSVQHAKLASGATVALKYRVDGATSWTTIFTNTTDDSLSHEAINIESSAANLPQYKEIEFRIEYYGGSSGFNQGITGFSFREEAIDKRLF